MARANEVAYLAIGELHGFGDESAFEQLTDRQCALAIRAGPGGQLAAHVRHALRAKMFQHLTLHEASESGRVASVVDQKLRQRQILRWHTQHVLVEVWQQ